MVLFGETKKPFSYDIIREGEETILLIDLEQYQQIPSLEDDEVCMSRTVDILAESGSVTKIVYTQKRNYEYDFNQTQMMQEIAKLYTQLAKQRDVFSYGNLLADPKCTRFAAQWYANIQNITADVLKRDPIGAYVELKRNVRDERINIDKSADQVYIQCAKRYISILQFLMSLMEKTRLIDSAKQYLPGYKIGDRSVYRRIFSPDIRPDFMFTKLMSTYPVDGDEIDSYELDEDTEVTIFELPDNVQYLYHLIPPEFKLSEEKYEILDTARKIMAEHKPTRQEFIDPERMRQVFYNIGSDLIEELVDYRGLKLSSKEIDEMTKILVRYTVGFGLIEVLLQDEKVQDITINSPMGETPMFIVHQDYADCKTNIIPTTPEAESWASKLRLVSGRPLDEANPILDTELSIPGANARIAVVAPPLNPSGLAFAFRRHRDKPWTLPLYIQNKMLNPLAAGILSFLIDGARSMIIAGTRSAGKTSLLGAVLVELMRKYRVITIEDSVTGDSGIIIKRNGKIERTTIGELIDGLINKYGKWYNLTDHEVTGNPENIRVFSMDKHGKIKLANVTKFIRHKVKKPVYKITTRTGRAIKVTGDHSLFGLDKDANIVEVKANELKEGSSIAVPRIININNKPVQRLNLLQLLVRIPKTFFYGDSIRKVLLENKKVIIGLRKELGYSKEAATNWFRKDFLPQQVLLSLMNHGIKVENNIYFSYSNSVTKIPVNIELNDDFLTFIGLWIADGCYDKSSVIISCNDPEDRAIFDNVARALNLKRKMHSDEISYMVNSKPLKILMKECLNLDGNAYTKRIPEWIYNLSAQQIAYVLKGIFSGDGCATDKEIVIPLSSIKLLKDIQFLLSVYGINLRIGKLRKDGTYNAGISTLNDFIKFYENIGFLQYYKTGVLKKLCNKTSTHDTSDVIPLSIDTKKAIFSEYKKFRYGDYIYKNNNVGRAKLSQIVELMPKSELSNNLAILSNSDIFWDEIKSIEVIKSFEDFVYDISVPECESFVCENIIAHNTLELPTNSLRKLGYNIQSMKVAAALTKGSSEVPADEGIRTTLRMGDSALIIGEIRSKEALALYEAMRIGALANVVAGTIHGDSPYGVFDRVVNDLGVPRTSFKATDVIVVANPVRSADGLHRWRRVTQITEVRKHWEQDPLTENGFVDLMKYDSKKDVLETSDELLNGDSEILKAIAGNVKEWAGNWDAVWDNIMLRARTKEELVNFATKTNNLDLLEADFVIQSNDHFHKISESVREETGSLDSKRIFFEWNEWLKRHVKKTGFHRQL